MPADVDPGDGHVIARTIPLKIQTLKKQGAEWLYIGPDTFIGYTHRRLVTFAALDDNLPSFASNESAIREGHALYGLF
jgi:putative ABC transport system substrate-binding protein